MNLLRFMAITACLVFSSQSFALIEGQVLVGQRSASLDASGVSGDGSGTETKLSVYVDPIPLVPVAAGLSFSTLDLGEIEDYGMSGLTGSEISLDVTAWLPIGLAGFKPYAN